MVQFRGRTLFSLLQPSPMGSTLKGKNLLQRSEFFPIRVVPINFFERATLSRVETGSTIKIPSIGTGRSE